MPEVIHTKVCEQCDEIWTARLIRWDEDICMNICPDCRDENQQEQERFEEEELESYKADM